MTPTAFWLKLWIDLLDDTKTAAMPDWLFRRWIYLLLAAKEYDKDGLLPPVQDLAWRLRLTEEQVTQALLALTKIGVASEASPGSYLIVNFKKRQAASDSADRVRRFRERKREHEQHLEEGGDCNAVTCTVSSPLLSSVNLNIFKLYEQQVGPLTPMVAEELQAAEARFLWAWIEAAFREAANANVHNWRYVLKILTTWESQGYMGQGSNGKGATATAPPKGRTGALAKIMKEIEDGTFTDSGRNSRRTV